MDLYSTSFTLPRPALRLRPPVSSPYSTHPALSRLESAGAVPFAPSTANGTKRLSPESLEQQWSESQKLAEKITLQGGCVVAVDNQASPLEAGRHSTYADPLNCIFNISGGYQSVLSARGEILRQFPPRDSRSLRVARTDFLESSSSTRTAVKPDVLRCLQDIARDTASTITVRNDDEHIWAGGDSNIFAVIHGASTAKVSAIASRPSSLNGGVATSDSDARSTGKYSSKSSPTKMPSTKRFGLRGEETCEVVLQGSSESVHLAKVRVLVLIDEFVRQGLLRPLRG